jgi:SAM-dependent methyltransferase
VSDLASAWERNAAAWIAWARTPGHDSYWRFHRDAFFELLPSPGRRTLDLGCGEGRLARDLTVAGHRVAGVDASPTLVAAAREADPGLDAQVADAAALPFADGEFDLVVAFMTFQDVADLDRALRECARVLEPEGRLCLAIVHPLNSAGIFARDGDDAPFVIEGSYVEERPYTDVVVRDGLEMTFASVHRPLETYAETLADAGFLIERLRESVAPEHALHGRRWLRIPLFLHVRALKPG